MKFFQKRAVAVVVLILAIVAGVAIGQAKKPDASGQASTAIVGSYTYVYDYAGVLTDDTMEHIDAMNASLFAQTGAQILVDVVNSTGGVDIMDYATDLGNTYGVGSAERNNGVVMLLALENISQGGLVGDYCVVVGTGLENYADDFVSLQSYYLESDFAAGDYDDGVRAAFDAFIDWFADHYGVTIREGYIPAVRETYSSGSGYYYTETHGYVAPAFGSLVSGVVVLLVVLLVLWVILDGVRYSRYRRRYLRPGMSRPTVLYYPVFWGRPRRPRPPRPPRTPRPPRRPPSGGTFGGAGGADAGNICMRTAARRYKPCRFFAGMESTVINMCGRVFFPEDQSTSRSRSTMVDLETERYTARGTSTPSRANTGTTIKNGVRVRR